MDPQLLAKLQILRLYLNKLPPTLPVPPAGTAKLDFRNFTPDKDWVEDAGEEAAVNRELEIQLGSRHMGSISLQQSHFGKRGAERNRWFRISGPATTRPRGRNGSFLRDSR